MNLSQPALRLLFAPLDPWRLDDATEILLHRGVIDTLLTSNPIMIQIYMTVNETMEMPRVEMFNPKACGGINLLGNR
jgi:hypothetical protein